MGVDACTHGSCIPLDQGISVIQKMPLPSQAIGLEASLITFFSLAREARLVILKLAAVIFAAGGFTAGRRSSGCFWK